MRTEYLEYLLHIAKTKSINTSAKELYISQQSLSKAIRSLETELGTALLERYHYGVELTEAGRLVVERAKIISDQVYKIDQELFPFVNKSVSTLQGNLHVGASVRLMNGVLYAIIGSFFKRNPFIKLYIDTQEPPTILTALQNGSLDVGLVVFWGPAASEALKAACTTGTDLIYEELYHSPMLICLQRQSPLAQYKSLTPQMLKPYNLIEFASDDVTAKVFNSTGGAKSRLEVAGVDMFKQMIRDGLGYGFIDELDWRENYTYLDKERMTAIALDIETNFICYGLLYRQEQIQEPLCQAFCQVVRERFNRIENQLGQ